MLQQGIYCGRCGHWTAAREGQLPRFCPVCGKSLAEPEESGVRGRPPGGASFDFRRRTSKFAVGALILAFVGIRAGAFLSLIALLTALLAWQRVEYSERRLSGRGIARLATVVALLGLLLRVLR